MYNTTLIIAEKELKDYIRDYRDTDKFIGYCKACNRYNSCWACPPFDFDTEEYIAPYKMAYIIGTKITLSKKTVRDNQGWDKCTKISYEIIEKVRYDLDKKLLELEKTYPNSRVFFGGACHICKAENCSRISGTACIAPDKIRPSLEAFGFDMGKTSLELLDTEMKWSKDGVLPEYFTLVSGFFTNHNLVKQDIKSIILR